MQNKGFKETLKHILALAQELLDSEAGTIFLLDNRREELIFEIVNGPKAKDLEGERLKVGEGIAGKTVELGEGLIVRKVEERRDFQDRFDRATGFKTQSLLTAPLRIRDRIIGVIELVNKKNGVYGEKDLKMLERFASSTSAILEIALLYERLEQSWKFVHNLIDNIPIPICLKDENGRIVYQNRALKNLSYRDELLFYADEKYNGETVNCSGKTYTLSLSRFSIRDETGRMVDYLTVIFIEITERIMLAKLMAEKEVKERFFAGVSHNLKNPLTPILGLSQILARSNNSSMDMVKNYATKIQQEAMRLGKIIEMFISLSRVGIDGREIIDLSALLKDLLDESIKLNMEFKPIYTLADKNDLSLAFSALFDFLKDEGNKNVKLKTYKEKDLAVVELNSIKVETLEKIKKGIEQEFLLDDPYDTHLTNTANVVYLKEIIERHRGYIEIKENALKIILPWEDKIGTGKILANSI